MAAQVGWQAERQARPEAPELPLVAAPSMDVAARIAQLHPATRDGGVEVRPLFVPAGQVQDDYAD